MDRLVTNKHWNAFAPICVVLSQMKLLFRLVELYSTVETNASLQSSVVAPKNVIVSSCVKLVLPSGVVNDKIISPIMEVFVSRKSDESFWLKEVSSDAFTVIFQDWFPTKNFGAPVNSPEQTGSKSKFACPVSLVSTSYVPVVKKFVPSDCTLKRIAKSVWKLPFSSCTLNVNLVV